MTTPAPSAPAASGPAASSRSVRQGLVASLLLIVAPAGALVLALVWRDRLPDPLPRHWNTSGDVDGTSGFVVFTALVLGAAAVLAVLGVVLARRARDVAGFSAPLTGWLTWFLSILYVGTLVASLDAARAEDVALPWVWILVALGVSMVVGLVLTKLLPPTVQRPPEAVAASSGLRLGDDEKVVWVGGARSFSFVWMGGLLALAGAVLLVVVGWVGLVLVAVGLLMGWMHSITVRIDDAGVRAVWGPFGWPGTRTALSDVELVSIEDAQPLQWGGWGYRMSTRGTAHMVRAGEAIVLERRGKKPLLITVDGADQAAEVLTALLERAAR
ncbi:DUF1648 domain-containing protein [Nocardioides yefusunii]|uniref:DUF1648 domain-containing protein n=1 Tax=Nocardioides yefusunii TaxID=2500546 RepID=A0ABW1QUR5_9ACTN|nr:DUF1648 domain-containing protein [Nocardioides yefusunii]